MVICKSPKHRQGLLAKLPTLTLPKTAYTFLGSLEPSQTTDWGLNLEEGSAAESDTWKTQLPSL